MKIFNLFLASSIFLMACKSQSHNDSIAVDQHTQSNAQAVSCKHLQLAIEVDFEQQQLRGCATWEIENKDAPYSELAQVEEVSGGRSEKSDALEPMDIKEDSIVATKVPAKNNKLTKTSPNSYTNSSSASSVSENSNKKPLSSGNFNVQVGAFGQEDGAIKVKNELQKKFASNKVDVKKVDVNGKTFFKVFIGGFNTYENAQVFKNANGLSNSVISGN
jgi:cell division protein FtsN